MTLVRMTIAVCVMAAATPMAAADLAERMEEIRRIAPPENELSDPVWLDRVPAPPGGGAPAPVISTAGTSPPLRSIEVAVAPGFQPLDTAVTPAEPTGGSMVVTAAPVVEAHPGLAERESQAPWYYDALDWIENLGMDPDCSCSADGYPCPQHLKKHHARYYPCMFPGYLPMWGYVPTRWRRYPEPGLIGPPLGPGGEILYEVPAGAPHPELLPRPTAP